MKIIKISAREIFDSCGFPTLACDITLENGVTVSASVPSSGTLKNSFEAIELRDGGARLQGKGVLKAIENIENVIAPVLVRQEPDFLAADLRLLELDGTDNKAVLGSNTTLAVSMAVARAQAVVNNMELYELIAHMCEIDSVSMPFPLFNSINGGISPQNGLAIQEFMIMPVGSQNFRASMECSLNIFHALGAILHKKGKRAVIGAVGGYECAFQDEREVFDVLMEAIEKSQADTEVVIAINVAAGKLYDSTKNMYTWRDTLITSDDLIKLYISLAEHYPLYSIEDGFSDTDVEGWQKFMEEVGTELQVVGDSLCATNTTRISLALSEGLANAALIKPNQAGTVTETLQAIKLCKHNEMNVIISRQGQETNDSFIADIAVGTNSGQIKAGGLSRGECMAKYNKLLKIEDSLMGSMLLDI